MFDLIEQEFAARGRTPKGRKALRAIFRATLRTVTEEGLTATSLDVIADRADLTQAALRHYFHTREELLGTFFVTATGWFRGRMAEILAEGGRTPQDTLERCLSWHLEYMEAVETVFWLETSAYFLRHAHEKNVRDGWYRWLQEQYVNLIGQMQPALGPRERQRRAYAILTLVLGAWITHGHGSALGTFADVLERRQLVLDAAIDIATA